MTFRIHLHFALLLGMLLFAGANLFAQQPAAEKVSARSWKSPLCGGRTHEDEAAAIAIRLMRGAFQMNRSFPECAAALVGDTVPR